MKIDKFRRAVFYFWGAMDLLYVVMGVLAIVPLLLYTRGIQDFLSYPLMLYLLTNTMADFWVLLVSYILPLLLICSIPVSMVLLFRQHAGARKMALWQSPVRVFCLMPSVMFMTWIPGFGRSSFTLVFWIIVACFELLKLYSLARAEQAGGKRVADE